MTQEFSYYGQLIADDGLGPVMSALRECSWRIELRQSGYDGTHYLTTPRDQESDLEMDSGQSRCFLFGGGFDGSAPRMLELMGEFSQCLSARGFVHSVEVYDEKKNQIGYFHHQWPAGLTEVEIMKMPSRAS